MKIRDGPVQFFHSIYQIKQITHLKNIAGLSLIEICTYFKFYFEIFIPKNFNGFLFF